MKKNVLAVLLFFLATMSAMSQTADKYGEFTKVMECNHSKTTLWINLKKWVSGSFTSYKHTVDLEDKESGTLVLKFNNSSTLSTYTDITIKATLKVDVRDKKYRYSISDAKYEIRPNSLLDNINYLPTSSILDAKYQMEAAQSLLYSPNLNSNFKSKIKAKEVELEGIARYKSEKDQKKNNENPAYKRTKAELDLMKSIDSKFFMFNYEIQKSIEEGMNVSDDF